MPDQDACCWRATRRFKFPAMLMNGRDAPTWVYRISIEVGMPEPPKKHRAWFAPSEAISGQEEKDLRGFRRRVDFTPYDS
jgi:hypothetical protein